MGTLRLRAPLSPQPVHALRSIRQGCYVLEAPAPSVTGVALLQHPLRLGRPVGRGAGQRGSQEAGGRLQHAIALAPGPTPAPAPAAFRIRLTALLPSRALYRLALAPHTFSRYQSHTARRLTKESPIWPSPDSHLSVMWYSSMVS